MQLGEGGGLRRTFILFDPRVLLGPLVAAARAVELGGDAVGVGARECGLRLALLALPRQLLGAWLGRRERIERGDEALRRRGGRAEGLAEGLAQKLAEELAEGLAEGLAEALAEGLAE